jgi:hypothetical protein
MNDYCGRTYDYISDYTIPGYPLRRASQTVQKLFEVTLHLDIFLPNCNRQLQFRPLALPWDSE